MCTRLKRSITCSDFVNIYLYLSSFFLYMANLNRNVTSSCLHNDHGGEALTCSLPSCVSNLPPKVVDPLPSELHIRRERDLPASNPASQLFSRVCALFLTTYSTLRYSFDEANFSMSPPCSCMGRNIQITLIYGILFKGYRTHQSVLRL